MSPLGELDRLHPRLIEENRSLEDIHRRSVEAWTEVHIPAPVLHFSLYHRRGGFAGQPCRMEEIVILENPDGTGPLQGCQGRLNRAPKGVVEGQKPGSLTGPQHKVRETLCSIGESADNECLRGGHAKNIAPRRGSGAAAPPPAPTAYGSSSDLGSTLTIQSPELMSGT